MFINTVKSDIYRQVCVKEYRYLSEQNSLDASQEQRLAYILNLAIEDKVLDEAIKDIDLELLSPQDKEVILDQQAKMREHLGLEFQKNIGISE